jgi:pilus assembly protein CpaB
MFIAIALAAGAFFITMRLTTGENDKSLPITQPHLVTKEVPTVDIYTAKQDIPIGEVIQQPMLDIQPWPKHLLLPDMIPANPNQPNEIVRMVARTPFQKGEPIILNKLANDKDPSFLAASLPKGMRVVTIAVDPMTGVGGFLFPGDRVDVLVTHDLNLDKPSEKKSNPAKANGQNAANVKKDPVTEVLLSNIRVMAVNMKSTAHGGEPPVQPSHVSLEVSAADAQKIRLTEYGNGRLSLALRSLKDREEADLPRPTGVGDLSRLTPPAYFPVLYDVNGQANFTSPEAEARVKEEEEEAKGSITVVRGVKPEEVEVSRP